MTNEQDPRWQMAFATVAGVALMIGLVTRSPVPQPALSTGTYAAAPQELARPAPAAAPMARFSVAPQADSAPQVQAEVAGSLADEPVAKMSKRSAVVLPPLEQGLQEILRLRQAGEAKAADEKLLELHKRFPKEDLPARLEALKNP